MVIENSAKTEFLIVDTSAFIKNANLQDFGQNVITIPEVINEIKSKRQIRRLVVLPYDLQVKEAYAENIKYVTEFSKKTGDYPSLSAADLKVIALTYQLEKEHVGTEHLRTIPQVNRTVDYCKHSAIPADSIAGFYNPRKHKTISESEKSEGLEESETESKLDEKLENLTVNDSVYSDELENDSESGNDDESKKECDFEETKDTPSLTTLYDESIGNIEIKEGMTEKDISSDELTINADQILVRVENEEAIEECSSSDEEDSNDEDGGDWITVSNIKQVKQQMDAENLDDTPVRVACLTTDFAMQNVIKQMGLNVAALDGRVIKQLRTFILRCYACFKTTSVMTKVFCPHCGNKTLKKVAVSLDSEGNQKIHINLRRPLTARGKKFSLPKPQGGKHANNPILVEDQPVPQQRITRLARMKNNPLEPDYIAGFSPFVMRDVNSKSAMLGIPNKPQEMKYWMRRNPNESHRSKKK